MADRPDVLQKRTHSHSLKSHTVDYLRHHTHSFAYTRAVLKTLYTQTAEEVRRLGGNKGLERILGKYAVPLAEDGEVNGDGP